jgi:hypothetical protein
LCDLSGVVTRTVADAELPSGEHEMTISTAGMAGGVYLLRIKDDSGSSAVKLMIIP